MCLYLIGLGEQDVNLIMKTEIEEVQKLSDASHQATPPSQALHKHPDLKIEAGFDFNCPHQHFMTHYTVKALLLSSSLLLSGCDIYFRSFNFTPLNYTICESSGNEPHLR